MAEYDGFDRGFRAEKHFHEAIASNMVQAFPSRNQFQQAPTAGALLQYLEANEGRLGLSDAVLYYSFPLYRDEDGVPIVSDAVLLSRHHGVIVFALPTVFAGEEIARCVDIMEQVPSYVQSRLVKNKRLRSGPTQLAFDISPLIYCPTVTERPTFQSCPLATSDSELAAFLEPLRATEPLSTDMFNELVSTIEGAKGLIRAKKRDLPTQDHTSKGKQAELIEAAITLFDQQQKFGIMGKITGPQRIRGLAGSGKTVILAMKAALTHLQYPQAKIAYTFYTKSLYQHVKRLITRFYRQFDDQDPDWERRVHILHGWGGASAPGLYSVACEKHGVRALSFREAISGPTGDRFDYACAQLMNTVQLSPIYDYVFVDEGQDFPTSFIRLCHALSNAGKFVLAYDDLQTIFQAKTPSTAEIFGSDGAGSPKVTFHEDVVLHKCYRNPREVLVSAHALGFGIYGDRIVQMLASGDHWEDIGYSVKKGDFVEGSEIVVERPKENSLEIISERNSFEEIVKVTPYIDEPTLLDNVKKEIETTADSVENDLTDGLQPDDVLVVTVDDRNAKVYLCGIESALLRRGISCNNLHTDSFGIRDFTKQGRVTLSTVHKAKGNEAFMVYVVGVDAVMAHPDVRRRNMLFTAMTRAKGWVRLSGVGEGAKRCKEELDRAKSQFPSLVFKYPGPSELKIMERDLAEAADTKLKVRRLIELLRGENLSDEDISEVLRRSQKERGTTPRKSSKGKM